MNQTAATIGNSLPSMLSDSTSLLTTVHLVWIAVLALLVIVAILYGVRQKQRRDIADRKMVDHAREAGVEPQAADRPDETAPPPAPAANDAANGPVDQLKGLGPKVAARLAELGITTVGQLAALDDGAARALDDQLGPFRGRLERDRWIEQARLLAAGDRAGFEAAFGKL